MYYRITDWCYPYAKGYNSTTLESLADALWNTDPYLWRDMDVSVFELLYWLKEGCDLFEWYYIEKSEKPFDEKDLDLLD